MSFRFLAANSVGDAGTGGVWEGYQCIPVSGSALGGTEVLTSLCVPSAFSADSSVAESAEGSLKPPEATRGICKPVWGACFSAQAPGLVLLGGGVCRMSPHSCHGVESWAVSVARQNPMDTSQSL